MDILIDFEIETEISSNFVDSSELVAVSVVVGGENVDTKSVVVEGKVEDEVKGSAVTGIMIISSLDVVLESSIVVDIVVSVAVLKDSVVGVVVVRSDVLMTLLVDGDSVVVLNVVVGEDEVLTTTCPRLIIGKKEALECRR